MLFEKICQNTQIWFTLIVPLVLSTHGALNVLKFQRNDERQLSD